MPNCNAKKAPKVGVLSYSNLNRIQIRNLRWLTSIRFVFLKNSKVRIILKFKIKDRDTGKPRPIWTFKDYNRSFFKSIKQIVDQVRYLTKWFVLHEVDECLYLDNKRLYDPH